MATTLMATTVKSIAGSNSSVARGVDALPHIPTNLSSPERWASLVVGTALSAYGLTERGPTLVSTLAGGYLLYRAASGHCPAYQALGVSTSESTAPNSVIPADHGTRVEHVVTVMKPVADVYNYWRDFENLPHFMTHLIDVDTTSDGRSHWVAKGPLGLRVEWDAELIADVPNKTIAWRSLPGADVDTTGSVHFRELPHGRGTEVRVNLKYDPPGGKLGTAVAKLFGENPDRQVREDLRRFRQILEASEVATVDGQSHGKR